MFERLPLLFRSSIEAVTEDTAHCRTIAIYECTPQHPETFFCSL